MNINFDKIIISNFLSIGQADIDLKDNGYVLVKGVNKYTEDSAISNGSGKSTVFEAIIWCLCGETLRGSKNVTNINGDDGALVELFFRIDSNNYHIIRSKDNSRYKTNLKLFVNDNDISGKGIRDTEKILSETLPELTSSFIGSVIILGQGMPQKFTNNSPSGRKEVLEKLSKSDFMIEDLKKRVSDRKAVLQKQLRVHEDTLLSLKSKLETQRNIILDNQNKLQNIESKETYEARLKQFNQDKSDKCVERDNVEKLKTVKEAEVYIESLKKTRQTVESKLFEETTDLTDKYNSVNESLSFSISELTVNKTKLEKYINDVENMTEICPTCHQRIEGVVKPDISKEKESLEEIIRKIKEFEVYKKDNTDNFNKDRIILKTAADKELKIIQEGINKQQNIISAFEESQKILNTSITELDKQIQECENFIKVIDTKRETLQESIEEGQRVENELCTQIHKERLLGDDTEAHLSVINKFDTMLKRDFRGYLLSNVITYIDSRAKNYAEDVFDTQDISFKLEGNNILISFQGKDYENLSGGERQKVDLIVQFSIRDMLSEYMNFSSSILVLDEIFDNLDSAGCEKVINMISKRFNDINSIYVISHHAEELNIPVDNYLTVIKNSNGVSSVV
nr:MAG TPA: STRUCTURAL MAINTENANCE OF CHROMOSOMES PROTEIN [Caudoviricetes sp.]